MIEQQTLKKTVRFQIDNIHEPAITIPDTGTIEAAPICKNTVRLVSDDPAPSDLTKPVSPPLPTALSPSPLSASAPPSIPPHSDSNAALPTEPSPLTGAYPTSPSLPPSAINACSEAVSYTPPTMSPAPKDPGHELSPTGTVVLQYDEGEKDANGNFLDPIPDESCEKCGGKIVWATKGEWYLICQGCQKPQ